MAVTAAPPPLRNWNQRVSTLPAVLVYADTVADVQAVVSNSSAYPSPVLPVGSMHSVTGCLVNDGGTLLSLSRLNRTLGLDKGAGLVRVQAGVKLADLHDWLGAQGWEITFCPEIGDATVGSLVVSTSKDSSLVGNGFLSALVREVTYVDASGALVTLTAPRDGPALARFISSNGVAGVTVEAVLQAQPQSLIRTRLSSLKLGGRKRKDAVAFARKLLGMRRGVDNAFMLVDPSLGLAYVEQRSMANTSEALAKAQSPGNQLLLQYCTRFKFESFMAGRLAPGALAYLTESPLDVYHYRRAMSNRYPTVNATQDRADFSLFEFQDIRRFVDIVASALTFAYEQQALTGFLPGGFAIYFVKRPGSAVKPFGSFSGSPGLSFMMDPFYHDPSDPKWDAFLDKLTVLMVQKGALLSLTQTKRVRPDQAPCLPSSLARPRFTTPYFAAYLSPCGR